MNPITSMLFGALVAVLPHSGSQEWLGRICAIYENSISIAPIERSCDWRFQQSFHIKTGNVYDFAGLEFHTAVPMLAFDLTGRSNVTLTNITIIAPEGISLIHNNDWFFHPSPNTWYFHP